MSTQLKRPSLVQFISDPGNMCTLSGLFCATLGIFLAVSGAYRAALTAMLWATFFDWVDGPVARYSRRSSPLFVSFSQLGIQLDSLTDIVTQGIGLGVIVICYTGATPWSLMCATALVFSAAIRLSYYNVFGLSNGSYTGLSTDNNTLIVGTLFIFEPAFDRNSFCYLLSTAVLALSSLAIAPFRLPKLTSKWVYALTCYVIIVTVVFAFQSL